MPPRTSGQQEWERIQGEGLQRYLVIGALRRGLPMAFVVLGVLELMEGGTFTRDRLLSAAFLERLVVVFAVFLAGGAISAYARWKSKEALYGRDSST